MPVYNFIHKLLLSFHLGGGELHAQNPKLTLKFRDAGMEQIMNEIEKQINYYFIVDKGVDIKRTLTIDVTDKPLTLSLIHI